MRAQWEGTLTGSTKARRAPRSLTRRTAASTAPNVARDHYLARGVEVGARHDLADPRTVAGTGDRFIVEAQDGGHLPGAARHGLLHITPAIGTQGHGFAKRQGPGAHQRRVFPKAVARDPGRPRTPLGNPDPPHGYPGREQGRLGLLGPIQGLGRAFLDQLPEVIAQGLGGLRKGVADGGIGLGQVLQHADRLGSLSRKHEAAYHPTRRINNALGPSPR